MSQPTDDQLLEAIETACAGNEDLEDDIPQLLGRIRDDHFMWKVNKTQVETLVANIKAARKPARQVPEELFDVGSALATSGFAAKIDERVDWSKMSVEGIHHAQGGLGSLGCFLVKLEGDGFVVLKQRTQGSANDLFATTMMSLVGIKSPKMRPLRPDEFHIFMEKMYNAPVSVKGTCNEIFESRFQEAGAEIMEFVRGKDLEAQNFQPSNHYMKEIGKIIAMDVVLNNPDRVPAIWRSEGNKGNIIIEGPNVVAIDQTVNSISDESLLDDYLVRAAKLYDLDTGRKIASFFNILPTDPNIEHYIDSTLSGMDTVIRQLKTNGQSILDKAYSKTKQQFPHFDGNGRVVPFCLRVIDSLPEPRMKSVIIDLFQTVCPIL